MLNEADEVLDEDLDAAVDYYESLLNNTLPQKQAERIALEQFGVVLDDRLLNRILEQYACTMLSIEDSVRAQLQKRQLI
ncbi:MAG: hypothetical protein Q8S55_07630 [Methylococcaceae bacterium]|jgi:hypothetical protein|nr:hypothetical protein [Methylococcaceae bacterium]